MAATLPAAESTIAAIDTLARAGLSAQELLVEAARRIDPVVPCDGFFLAATDPQTTLCIGAGLVQDLPRDMCEPTWNYEFLVPDYLKFVDIAFSGSPVADLHEATGGRPERSARWREYGAVTGFRSELRTAFTLNGAMWGIGQFDRLGDAPRFSDEERAWLGRVAPVLAQGLRRALLNQPAIAPGQRGPGLLLLDGDGRVVSATREAAEWLEEVESVSLIPTRASLPVPVEVQAFAAHVRLFRSK